MILPLLAFIVGLIAGSILGSIGTYLLVNRMVFGALDEMVDELKRKR